MFNQNYYGKSCGCNTSCPQSCPTYQTCNQVVQTANVEDVPHYINYNTHVINNCIKRHINIPTYSTSSENVMINEYAQAAPMYQQPVMYNQYYQQQMYSPNQYQGNVGTEGYNKQYNPFQQMSNLTTPFGNQ